jgi:triacylglycerol lipase
MQNKKSYTVTAEFVTASYWDKVELLEGSRPEFIQETFHPVSVHHEAELISQFGTDTPNSRYALLHYKIPKKKWGNDTPVLLVHGASHYAKKAWLGSGRTNGLAAALYESDIPVFALSFAHSHGDNYLQGIQIANALSRIQEATGANSVDIVCHSKGGVPARLYLANLLEAYGAAYQDNVRKFIMLGAPNKGVDFPFRNLQANWFVLDRKINAPVACDSLYFYGRFIDCLDQSLYKDGGAFPGQSQLLYRWDDQYPVLGSAKTLYEGGQDFYFHSRGIDLAIKEGGSLIERLLSRPLPGTISLYALAGTRNFFGVIPGESSAPSDGLVFVESALALEQMASNSNQIRAQTYLPLNHLELLYDAKAHRWVLDCLADNPSLQTGSIA